jgi:hypothetical protein
MRWLLLMLRNRRYVFLGNSTRFVVKTVFVWSHRLKIFSYLHILTLCSFLAPSRPFTIVYFKEVTPLEMLFFKIGTEFETTSFTFVQDY